MHRKSGRLQLPVCNWSAPRHGDYALIEKPVRRQLAAIGHLSYRRRPEKQLNESIGLISTADVKARDPSRDRYNRHYSATVLVSGHPLIVCSQGCEMRFGMKNAGLCGFLVSVLTVV